MEAINAPLGFFVLALLIVESFLTAALLGVQLDKQNQLVVLWMGVGMFVLVVLIVALLVWWRPEHLTFDKQAHLTKSRAIYGTDTRTIRDLDALLPSERDRNER